jgi:H+/Cl- antiporter ClcA
VPSGRRSRILAPETGGSGILQVEPLLALGSTPQLFVVAAMGAPFAGAVRALLTGIVRVVELTGALPMPLRVIITGMASAMMAQALRGRPVYTELRQC